MALKYLSFFLIIAAVIFAWEKAHAHDWYTGERNIYGSSCCDGEGNNVDCAPIPNETVEEVPGGFIITLSKEQMKRIKPKIGGALVRMSESGFGASANANMAYTILDGGIREFVSFRESLPSVDNGYSACLGNSPEIRGGIIAVPRWILCFFRKQSNS